MEGPEIDEDVAGYFVFDVPVLAYRGVYNDRTVHKPDRVLQPVLAVRTPGGDTVVPDEALLWSRSLIDDYSETAEVRRKLNSVGRLFEFAWHVAGDASLRAGMMDEIAWEYLHARALTPVDPSLRLFPHWKSVRYMHIHTEFRDIVEFAKFCADYTGPSSAIGSAFKAGSARWRKVKRAGNPDGFLIHLEAQRDRWNIMFGDDEVIAPPSSLRRIAAAASVPRKGNDTSLDKEQVDAIIDREGNFMFRALWILLAYAGPRISEALNMWLCDVLDPQSAARLFRAKFNVPAVIFADPKKSLYTGSLDIRRARQSRTDYLARLGRKPFPDMQGQRQRLGWKSMSVFNASFIVTHGTWTCDERGAEFADLVADIRDLHGELGIQRVHPYLFVNSRNAEHLGMPLKLSNVVKAFERACRRAGIEPYTPGASLHGMRHFYTWYAKHELGLSDKTVQGLLRHKNPASQNAYGKRASDINEAMEKRAKSAGASSET